ncbi:50S ribosomal protein L17 [Calditerrivibrio nitroreducens]|uniref:Large ribosomal subunit protein bL17 n=1 Tax=Calditerrivibrio nitroreducens (strain DSM 19672 / NBRC 101217 / Yu37-1) TaxID=768670 RepID=E4TEN0_CALNY|nr:50S ribosomal protein L17 [Calditerrivibrio nitroreducens]ADR19387.1 LSU ribosomal protein L17P [Calditerrivibrio nitroreducens DSM 19672]
MRHKSGIKKLGRPTDHRLAMLRNMAISLIEKGRIETTVDRAKALRTFVEPIITLGKKGDLSAIRLAYKKLHNKDAVRTVFKELAPRYKSRPGGYTRVLKTRIRRGDNATMAIIEFVKDENQEAKSE